VSTVDLSVSVGDLVLANPFVVGSGPTVKTVRQIREAEDAGWAGASVKLSISPNPYLSYPPRYRWLGKRGYHVFSAERRLSPEESLELIETARRQTSRIKILANIAHDGDGPGGWAELARRFESAGAHVIELNLCCPNMSFNVSATSGASEKSTGASVGGDESRTAAAVAAVRDAISVPVVAKLTPEGGRIGAVAKAALANGAHAAGGTANRLGVPDFDINRPAESIYRLLEENTLGCLSGPWLLPLALRDTFEMRRECGGNATLFSSGGISNLRTAVQHMLVGADALWVCTATMTDGFAWLPKVLDGLRSYMKEMGYSKIRDFRGAASANIRPVSGLTVSEGWAAVDAERCSKCGRCVRIGHCDAVSMPAGGAAVVDRERCTGCSTCVDVCPVDAISMVRASETGPS